MRLIIQTGRSAPDGVSFDYQHDLVRIFHRWLGHNDLHDKISLYSISWLQGSSVRNGALIFPNGAQFFIGIHEHQYAEQLVQGIMKSPWLFGGMIVKDVQLQSAPEFDSPQRFFLASPVFIKKQEENGNIRHILFDDPQSGELLTQTLKHKMDRAGIDYDDSVKVYFDKEFQNPKTKLITIKGIQNRASMCPVIVEGSPEHIAFAWDVGIGNGTGACFGAVR
jgi:CRISPR-associated endoribonuclease Cas6